MYFGIHVHVIDKRNEQQQLMMMNEMNNETNKANKIT